VKARASGTGQLWDDLRSTMWQVEVRTPTYRRPALLERALRSLIGQTHPHWRCIVLDDEPGGGQARDVCAKLNDQRITYRPNEHNLGVGPNIDAAFTREPLSGSTHACVLEDDNYYLPDFMAANLSVMTEQHVDIVLRNPLIEEPTVPNGEGTIVSGSIYDGQFVDGIVSKEELWATFFFAPATPFSLPAASNANLFWRLGQGLSFSTLGFTDDPVFQEHLRTLCLDRPVYVAMEPKVVWRNNGTESIRPKLSGLPFWLAHIRWLCRQRTLYRQLYQHLCQRGALDYVWRSRFREIDAACERVFWKVGIKPPVASRFSRKERAILIAKGELARMIGVLVAEPTKYRIGNYRVEDV
jgi:glycosyltransferase involved in cell wall biosynthesis